MDLTRGAPDLRGWIPTNVDLRPEVPEVHWCHAAGTRLTAPFYDGDLTRLMRLPFNRTFDAVTSIDDAASHLDSHPPLTPTAFIFHIGRCGSTLVSRLLAADPANRVVSEPAPFDQVMRAPLSRPVTPDRYHRWLRTMVGALGQHADGETRLFVKLDSWASAAAAHLDQAFPGAPWLFVYRDPIEVLVSLLASPPATLLQAFLGPKIFGIAPDDALHLSREQYAARVVGVLVDNLADQASRAWLIEHPELPGAVMPWLEHVLDIRPDPAARAAMQAIAGEHAKHPGTPFDDDRASKQARATPELRSLVETWAAAGYARLCAERARQVVP